MYKLCPISKIPDMFCSMAVARQHDRNLILHTILQDLTVIFFRIPAISVRHQRSFVDLKNHPIFPCAESQRFIIYRKSRIITMSKHLYTGMSHCIQISTRIFFDSTTLIILRMHTCNCIIQFAEQFVIQIQMSLRIQNI